MMTTPGTTPVLSSPPAPCRSRLALLTPLRRLVLPAFLGVCAFGGGGVAVCLQPNLASRAVAQTQGQGQGQSQGDERDLTGLSDQFEAVAKKVSPAVVAIDTKKPALVPNGRRKAVEDSGSGVLVQFEGKAGVYVLTNNHVVSEATPQQVTVSLADGRVVKPTRLLTDPESDIALLAMPALKDLTTARLGDSDRMRVGHWVVAIGSPFGLNQTVTHGIISARERGEVSLGATIRIKDFLQTDAAINPGSSGGPLLNLDGEVIGINTAIASNSGNNSGVAFSIPVNLVKRVTRQLLEKGSVARGYLGMQLAQSFEPADALRLGLDRVQGGLVETVYTNTPAASAGLRKGDVVLQVDQTVLRNENHFINLISSLPVGKKIRLKVWRDRKVIYLDAQIGDWSKGQAQFRASR